MANQEFQQSAARAEALAETKKYSNGPELAVQEVFNELVKIEKNRGLTTQQKSSQEAEYLKAVMDQNKVLKEHGFPEFELIEDGKSLTFKASKNDGSWKSSGLPALVWEGQESRNLHFGENLQRDANVNFDVKLPYGVREGDVVEGRIFSNSTNSASDHVRGRVVSVNGQLHFQGDESIVVRDKNTGISYPANNRNVGPYDKGGQLDIPLTLHN